MTLSPLPLSQFAHIDGVRLHYQVLGPADAMPLIFTHGGGPGSTAWSNFRLNAPAFSQHFRCYFLDLAQFGGSDRVPAVGPMWSFHANLLVGFMDALGLSKAHLVNQSFGSGVALKLAAEHPDRVGKIITIGAQPVDQGALVPMALTTKHAAHIMHDYFAADGGPSLEKMRALIARYEMHDDSKLCEQTVELRYLASIHPEHNALMRIPGFMGEPQNLLPELSLIKAPVLICWGLYDWFGAVDVAMMMVNRLPKGEVHVFGQGAHHLQSECVEAFNRVALGFLGARDE